MSFLGRNIARAALLLVLMLTWIPSQAIETFFESGIISKIRLGSFNTFDQKYVLTPTAKINIPGVSDARLTNLKKGDAIIFRVKVVGQVHYVDTINFIAFDD